MMDYALPAGVALIVWWFTTGAILYLDGLPRRTHGWSMAGATAAGGAALVALARSADDTTSAGAYTGFSSTVAVWGWLEMSFLMGYITGPRRVAATPDTSRWQHFSQATQAVIYHELAIVAVGAVVYRLTRDGANAVAMWTFGVLWAMRLSAKLNLFFGVPNVNAELLPAHLRYLGSYFRTRPMNLLFPASITASTAAAGWLLLELQKPQTAGQVVAMTLVLALLSLAILEHWFMVLPLPANELWRWAIRSEPETAQRPAAAKHADVVAVTDPTRLPRITHQGDAAAVN